jgi:hypothetical protein
MPSFLPPAEWLSIQNGHPTIIATFSCAISFSFLGTLPFDAL